jgi:hypothetical protein
MFEHHKEPLLDSKRFIHRQIRFTLFSVGILIFSIVFGMVGYRITGELTWIDSFHNASMILTGMGPVDHLHNHAGKIFSSIYALFSGITFLTLVAVLLTPAFHRILHKFHLNIEGDE